MRIFKISIIIAILSNLSYVNADTECYISAELPISGLNCWFKSDIERLVDDLEKQYITTEAELYFGKIINNLLQTNSELQPEFKIMLKSLFETKIIFLFKDIDKIINSIALDKPLKTIIENSLIKIDQIILYALQQHSKQQLNKYFDVQITNIHKKFRQNISRFLDESKYFSERMNCTVETTVASISQNKQLINKGFSAKMAPFSLEITSMATGGPLIPIPMVSATGNVVIESKKNENATNFDSIAEPMFCYQQLGLEAPPETWEHSTIYDLKKCKILNSLTPKTPIKRILNVYIDLKAWAAKMACIQHGAGYHATQHYIWDWLEFGYLYNLWYIQI